MCLRELACACALTLEQLSPEWSKNGPKRFQKWCVLACAGVCLDLGTIKIRKNGRKMNLESILGK